MALTKTDKEYLDLKIKNIVKDAAVKTAKEVIETMPCESMRAKVENHNNILHNGIKDSMDRLGNEVHKIDVKVDDHIKKHEDDRKERAKDRGAFWRGFRIALISAATGGVFSVVTVFLTKYLGG